MSSKPDFLCEARVKRYRWCEEWGPCGAFSKEIRDGHAVCGIHLRAKRPVFDEKEIREHPTERLISSYLYSVGAAKPDTWARGIADLLQGPDR